MAILVRNGTLVTMDRARAVLRADLLIDGGRIARIGEALPVGGGKEGTGATEVIDAAGCLVIPGLVQAHVHLCQTLFRGRAEGKELLPWLREHILPLEAAHDEASMRASARLGIAELLLGGTTAVQDLGTVRHTEALFEEAARAGIRYLGGKAMIDREEGTPRALVDSRAASLEESVALARRFHGTEGERLRYAFSPRFLLSCSDELLGEAAAQARSVGVRIHTHASENRGECAAVRTRTGRDNIEAFAVLGLLGPDISLAHCVWLSEREQRLLAETGTRVVHCPSANLKLASGVARIPELIERGISVGIGADGAACNDTLDAFVEMRLAGVMHLPRVGAAGFPAQRVVEMATLGGARALGLEDEIGSLEEGKRADVVIVGTSGLHLRPAAKDPYTAIVFQAKSTDVRTVIVDGRVLVRERRLQTLDEAEIAARAEEQGSALFRRVRSP